MHKGLFSLALLAFALLLSPAALADPLTIALAKPVQSGAPGTTFSFTATLTNTTGAVLFLNGDAFTLPGLGKTLDDTGFFNNFPFSLTPNQSVTNVLFTVSTLSTSQLGPFTGSYSILGGGSLGAYSTLGTANYSVTLAAAATPEPSSLMLLGTGATAALGLLRRRKTILNA